MHGHEFDLVLRRRAEDFVGVCRCGWTTPPMPSRSLAEVTLAFHVRESTAAPEPTVPAPQLTGKSP